MKLKCGWYSGICINLERTPVYKGYYSFKVGHVGYHPDHAFQILVHLALLDLHAVHLHVVD